jgi:3-oxoacyl-[acyl-carrier-protein] synthase II
MDQRRIVVTGMGLVSPLGSGVDSRLAALAGRTVLVCVRQLPEAVVADLPTRGRRRGADAGGGRRSRF